MRKPTMPRTPRSTRPSPRSRQQSTSAARSAAGPADLGSDWSPTGAEDAIPDAPAPIAEDTTRPQGAVSDPDKLCAQRPQAPHRPWSASDSAGRLRFVPVTAIRFDAVPWGDEASDEQLRPYRMAAEVLIRKEDVARMLGWAATDERFVDQILALLRRWYIRSACEPRALVCDNSRAAIWDLHYENLRAPQDDASLGSKPGGGL